MTQTNANTSASGNQVPTSRPFSAIGNVRLFIAFRLFFNSRFYYPVFTILFLDFGLTVAQFALLNAVWAATIVIMEVPSGALADIIGRRKLLVATGGLMVVEMMLLCFAPRGNTPVVFIFFMANRILSGIAEASASGADEAIAFDTLKKEGNPGEWANVLEMQMRIQSIGFIAAMSIGAAVYDPTLVQALVTAIGFHITVTREMTLRIPLFLSLVMALLTLWTALKMREPVEPSGSAERRTQSGTPTTREAFALTLQAGGWILRTPFAIVIILAGLTFDGIARMVVTLSSQYYRVILVPEALFGIIGSVVAMMGLFVPRIARWMATNRSPAFNLFALAALTLASLSGMNRFTPYAGLIPAVLLFSTMYFTSFFVSHYLNNITASHRRATVLSFKGLSFNLFYGLIGLLYSLLLAHTRTTTVAGSPGLEGEALENLTFISSFNWFPWTFIVLLIVVWCFALIRLKKGTPDRS